MGWRTMTIKENYYSINFLIENCYPIGVTVTMTIERS